MASYIYNNLEVFFISDDDSTIKCENGNNSSKLIQAIMDSSYNLFTISETNLESAFTYKERGWN